MRNGPQSVRPTHAEFRIRSKQRLTLLGEDSPGAGSTSCSPRRTNNAPESLSGLTLCQIREACQLVALPMDCTGRATLARREGANVAGRTLGWPGLAWLRGIIGHGRGRRTWKGGGLPVSRCFWHGVRPSANGECALARAVPRSSGPLCRVGRVRRSGHAEPTRSRAGGRHGALASM